MTFTTEPCHPHLSPPPPSPTCQQPWDGGRFWGPPPRASRLCLSQFSSHLPLSLSLPSSPSGPTGHWFSLSGRPLAAPSLSKEVCPPSLGDPQMMRGQGHGQLPLATMAWALLRLMATDAQALPCQLKGGSGCLLSAITCVDEALAATPPQPAPVTTPAPPGGRSLGAARR